MFSNLSMPIDAPVNYPISDSKLPFAEYIARSQAIVKKRRTDLSQAGDQAELIIEANSPFELYPNNPIRVGNRLKYGALLIHGLLDGPFSLRDVGVHLQANGILSRAILLPGHGTTPSDLLHVSYHDWIQAVRYGIESLQQEADKIFLVGYSTGATLSIYHALQDSRIAGIISLSPAIKIKTPLDTLVQWYQFTKCFSKTNKQWICKENEIDYVKYQSVTFKSVAQVTQLTNVIRELRERDTLTKPIYMVISREDETVSSHKAIDFFSNLHNPDSQLLLYTSHEHYYPDPRIITRLACHPLLHIKHCSHMSIPFASNNVHYGMNGNYQRASHFPINNVMYGGYNSVEEKLFDKLYALRLTKYKRRELTYNPDFDYMADEIVKFIFK